MANGNGNKVYEIVTDKVIAALESGTVPWVKPWDPTIGAPRSMNGNRPYRGVNIFLLGLTASAHGYSSPYWGTYKHIGDLGGQVRKGEKSTLVTFFKRVTRKDENGEPQSFFMLRYFSVFNAEQADDLPERFYSAPVGGGDHSPIAEAEAIVAAYPAPPTIEHGDSAAYYRPASDLIRMPDPEAFVSTESYYSTLFHEMIHSTGHSKRLNRDTLNQAVTFGTPSYSKEELVAEMGAAMLCGVAGIDNEAGVNQSAAYIRSWLSVLKGDPKMVVQAAGKAQRAADHILGVEWSAEPTD